MIFVMGAAVGSFVTWKLIENKYVLMTREDDYELADDINETIDDSSNDISEENHESNEEVKEETYKTVYKDLVEKHGYTDYSGKYQTDNNPKEEKKEVEEVKVKDNVDKPYVISPDEFGELDDYECISLSYFDDDVLTDDNYELVDDIDETVGLDSLNHFGEYEDDSVFVRNDKLKCDYEILLDHRNYTDVIETMPYIMRG